MKKATNEIIKILKQDTLGWQTILSGIDRDGYIDYEDCDIINICSKWYLSQQTKKYIDRVYKSAKDKYKYEGQDKLEFVIDILFEEILDIANEEYQKSLIGKSNPHD